MNPLPTKTKVLVVGAGVTGLTATLFLARQGFAPLLVERHPGTSLHPRARGVNGRTMELMRSLGLEARVRAAGSNIAPSVGVYTGRSVVETLARKGDGGLLMRWMRRRQTRGERFSNKSPTGPARITQDHFEPVLLQAARELGVDARFSTELTAVRPVERGVLATLLDRATGQTHELFADWIIAADGARSPMRERLGITQSGPGVLTHQVNLYFRADLTALVRGREFSMLLVENPQVRGLVASVNNSDLWVMHVSYDPTKGERPEHFTAERATQLVRAAVGLEDLQVELKGVMPWQSAVRVADRYREGRVFLAGDAAHVMPPWGGFGANTGMQDAHNLAWKLAMVLRGEAAEALLDTYQAERRPVAVDVSTIAGAMNDERGLMRGKTGLDVMWKLRKSFAYLVVGYGYSSRAVLLERGPQPGPGTTELRGRPGTRLPHVWLRDGRSSLDLVGDDFVLLGGPDAEWIDQTGIAAHRLDGAWAKAAGLSREGAALVRPDGVVAWRARRAVDAGLAREARQRVLSSTA